MNQCPLELPWTGERYVPQIRGSIALEHLHRYAMASEFVQGKHVLDVACGEGYGSDMLARTAVSVIGVDIDEATIIHAKKKYRRSNLSFKQGSCIELPLANNSIDIVVSFETIEHIAEHEKMLSEIQRVLKAGGLFIISSPEKHEYTKVPNYQNPYHIKELCFREFQDLLGKFFKKTRVFGQRVIYGSSIFEVKETSLFKGVYDFYKMPGEIKKEKGTPHPLYLIALCSDVAIPEAGSSFCEQFLWDSENIKELKKQLEQKNQHSTDKESQLINEKLQIQLKERDARIAQLKEQIHKRDNKIDEYYQKIVEQENQITKKSIQQILKTPFRIIKNRLKNQLIILEIAKSGLFNKKWYLEQNPDVALNQEDPILHYIHFGAQEERDPHPNFNIKSYLDNNPDVAQSSLNPLYHYIKFGKKEGRLIKDSFLKETKEKVTFSKKRDYNTNGSFQDDIRAIAIYLPQFHCIKENDAWWGEGFTEWTNVKRGRPFYPGHYQPHIPHSDLGYYNLDEASVLEKQVELARQHGIHGFCYYYYWFNGKKLLEKPLDRLLQTGKPDFPFCFCWANENWTRTWDGGDSEVLIEQVHSYENDEKFIYDIIPALKDPRYIRVNNKPLLIIYRPGLLPNMKATAEHWRKVCKSEGIGEIYLACMRSLEIIDPLKNGLDAAIQFPPANVPAENIFLKPTSKIKKIFSGYIYNMEEMISFYSQEKESYPLIRAVCPSWDNTARRMERATSWIKSTPNNYYKWLVDAIAKTRKNFKASERLLFINAWNEWGEGCHLEPDTKYGYEWLNATKKALQVNSSITSPKLYLLIVSHDAARAGAQIVLLNLLKEWKKSQEFQIKVICVGGGILYSEFEELFPTLLLEGLETTQKETALESFIEKQPDLIYSNTVVNGPFLLELKNQYRHCPVVTHIHELQQSIERWASGPIMEATITSTDYFIAVSKQVKKNLETSYAVSSKQIFEVQPGIPISSVFPNQKLRSQQQAELGIKEGQFICFGCGSTDWRKGPDLFVETAKHIVMNNSSARFFWIGGKNFQDVPNLEERIQEWGLQENIQFIGERISPREYFALGDIFFLSSREDPFPLVALEAADAKLPIVCFEGAGGVPEFVANDAGIIVPYENTKAAAVAVNLLINNRAKKILLGNNAKKKVSHQNDIKKTAEKISVLLREKIGIYKAIAPLVSVIVPNYNHALYLEERLNSITHQSYKNLEIIILDDASHDSSKNIIEQFLKKEPRARAMYNESNSGSPFKQWRKGIQAASGKYIWIAESDDSADHHLVEELVRRLEEDASLSLATCQLVMMDKAGSLGGTPDEWLSEFHSDRWKSDYTNNGIEEIRHFLSKKNTILNASGVIMRNFDGLTQLIDDQMRFCADWLLWVQLLEHGNIAYIAKPLNRWRISSGNARNSKKGTLELAEGPLVIREIGRILKWEEQETKARVNQFKAVYK